LKVSPSLFKGWAAKCCATPLAKLSSEPFLSLKLARVFTNACPREANLKERNPEPEPCLGNQIRFHRPKIESFAQPFQRLGSQMLRDAARQADSEPFPR
jgi:hypothetical protein